MSKTIKIHLSASGIRQAIKELETYKLEIQRKTSLLVSKLAEEGFRLVTLNLGDIHFTGDLQNSVSTEVGPNRAIIQVSSEYAIYVEFGTGPKGLVNQHPDNQIGYRYNVGKTIGFYYINGKLTEGWFYPGDDGIWHFTEGMPSRPFMYNSAQTLRYQSLKAIVKEVFG